MIPVLVKLSIVAQFNKQRERERERERETWGTFVTLIGNFCHVHRELW